MDATDARLRNLLFVVRLSRELAHQRVVRESTVTRQLHSELHEAVADARRLRRRARWLLRTKKPLPTVVP